MKIEKIHHVAYRCKDAGFGECRGIVFPNNSLIIGSPAKVHREMSDAEIARRHSNTADYVERRAYYKKALARID